MTKILKDMRKRGNACKKWNNWRKWQAAVIRSKNSTLPVSLQPGSVSTYY